MDARSHNLLQGYYRDGSNDYHYKTLKSGDNLFRVDFTRTVSDTGVELTIRHVTAANDGPPPTPEDVAFLTNEIDYFQNRPLNGNECVTLGWTYLGNMRDNAANIEAAKAVCESHGHTFQSLFYQKGYFVFGCIEEKVFYDNYT